MNRILPLICLCVSSAADDDARLHRRVVEQPRPEPEHALDEVGLDEFAPQFGFVLAKEHAVREEDGAAAGLRVHAPQDVLEEGVVGAALRRRAEEVAAPRIALPRGTVPLLDRVGRIGEDHVEGAEAVALDEAGELSVLPAAMWKSDTPWRTRFIRAIAAVMVMSSCP